MDSIVTVMETQPFTMLVSAASRVEDLGQIVQEVDGQYVVSVYEGTALVGIDPGPYESADAAMAMIGQHLGGSCTRLHYI